MELKKGMKVYGIGGMSKSYRCVGKIERLTATQVILDDGQRFWTRNMNETGEIKKVGAMNHGGYVGELFYVETPELMKLVREQELREEKVIARTKIIDRIERKLWDLDVYEEINKILDDYDK